MRGIRSSAGKLCRALESDLLEVVEQLLAPLPIQIGSALLACDALHDAAVFIIVQCRLLLGNVDGREFGFA
jgi:hypothetical protein